MLIRFSVKNHRAFREEQTFLMAAGDDTEHTRPHRAVDTEFQYAPRVLTSACIVGPNGAGKSSFIDAMRIMSTFARPRYLYDEDDEIEVEPFAFHTDWVGRPSEFEVEFIQNNTLYQYGFSLTRSRVIEEWLFACGPNDSKLHKLFSRAYHENSGEYELVIVGAQYENQEDFWKSVTKSNKLFLSVANEYNITDDIENARIWIAKKFSTRQVTSGYTNPQFSSTARRFKEKGWNSKVIKFLFDTGISIDDISVDQREDDLFSEWLVAFSRLNNNNDSVSLDLREESRGTRDLFELAAPILDALENGSTLVVDELNLGLHPLAFESLVSMFYNSEINKNSAQIIFTTHDLASIHHAQVDYDQIWLVDKNDELAAEIHPFSDYRVTGKRSFMAGYLQGLYGAIPRTSRIKS